MEKKLLFLGRFPPPIHGAAIMNKNYFESLDKDKDFSIKKIKINYSNSLDKLGKINFKKFFGIFAVFFKILFNLTFFRPKIVYFEIAPKGLAFYRDSIYVLLCKLFRRKIIFHFHAKGISKIINNKLLKKYYIFIFKNTKVILLSNILYEDMKSIINKNQIEILPNGIKDELAEKEFKEIIKERSKNKKLNLLFLSNMIESKGPLDVLKICNELKNKKIDLECNFIGKFQDEEFGKIFFEELKKLKLEKSCDYLGPQYGKDKKRILKKTNYLIFPTKYPEECFPLVILESFMYGIPVLSYNNGAIREIIDKNFLGFVSKKNNWKKLSERLINRLNKKENSDKIRKYFNKNYRIETAKQNLLNILNKI
jgi:glycosyltransferase involved in cell wall biosynthesis